MDTNFGPNIRFLRKKHKLTLEELAVILKISKSAISDYETSKTFPSIEVCDLFASHFKINLENLRIVDIPKLTNEALQSILNTNYEQYKKLDFSDKYHQIEFENKLLQQQIEGLQINLKLIRQVVESKDAEIKSLRIQLKLLNEKYTIEL